MNRLRNVIETEKRDERVRGGVVAHVDHSVDEPLDRNLRSGERV